MTQDQINELARESGFRVGHWSAPAGPILIVTSIGTTFEIELSKFAALVAKHEREQCARVCDQIEEGALPDGSCVGGLAWECADAIRARGEK